MKIEKRRAVVGSVHIHYKVAGVGAPLVLIHGLSGSSRWWARNVVSLGRHFRVYSIDLIGFGGSRGRHRFVLSAASDYLARWMKSIDIDRAHVIGHSMGGYIAAELAAHHPERVDKLVLVDAAAVPFGRTYTRNVMGLAHASLRLPFSFWPILITDALRAGPVNILSASRELLNADISDELRKIKAPTLIIWGERDMLIPQEIGHRIKTCLPSAGFSVIRRAGHNPMWDRPQEFNRIVLNFLTSSTTSPAHPDLDTEPFHHITGAG